MKNGESLTGKRFRIRGLEGRDHYIVVDNEGVICTFPDNLQENHAYQATATALSRMISIAIQGGVDHDMIIKQLSESSMVKNDLPHVILQALIKYGENK